MIKVPSSSRTPIGNERHDPVPSTESKSSRSGGSNRPGLVADMAQCVKLMNEDMNRPIDATPINDILTDNVGFIVVAAIGLQGSGKSTLLNCLSELSPDSKSKPFLVEDLDCVISGLPASYGIDMFVTSDRVILLDTQPVLSLALNEALCNSNTKRRLWQNSNSPESSENSPPFSPDNWSEMTSLMMLSFLFSVCHVVVVVEDYFTNLDLLHLINTASMIKPSIYTSKHPSMSTNSSDLVSQEKEVVDYHAKLVFVQNKAPSPALLHSKLRDLQLVLSQTVSENRINQIRERVWHSKLSRSSREPEEKPIVISPDDSSTDQKPVSKNVNDTNSKEIEEISESNKTLEVASENKLSNTSNHQGEIHSLGSTQKEADPDIDITLTPGGIIATNQIDALKTSATKTNDKLETGGVWTDLPISPDEEVDLLNDEELPDLFILPLFDPAPANSIAASYSESVAQLRKHIFSISRCQMIKTYPQTFTEKRWLQFSKKMWESISVSPLLGDYHRHLNAS